jgi:hypothetical protein
MVLGLTVRFKKRSDGRWNWALFDVQGDKIGQSLLTFPEKVDCYLNYAAHCAMPEAEVFVED